MTCKMTPARSGFKLLTKVCLISVAMLPMAMMPTHSAFAVNGSVKKACKGDYLAYCSNHAVGSQGLRKCMRAAGGKLSKTCVKALVAAGEVSKSDMARYAKRTR